MNDALAAAWRTAQARVAVTDEWRSFPSEALDRQYYRPLTALAQRAAAPQVTYDGLPIYRLLRAGERALLPQALDQARRFLLQLRERDDRTLLLHGVSGLPLPRRLAWLPVERWAMPKRLRDLAAALSEGLREIAAQVPHVWFVDEIAVAQRLGYRVANRPIVTGRPFAEALFHRRRFGFGLAGTYLEVVRAYDRLRGGEGDRGRLRQHLVGRGDGRRASAPLSRPASAAQTVAGRGDSARCGEQEQS